MRSIRAWWQERRTCRENAAYLEAEVEIIDLAALERERDESLIVLDPERMHH